MFNAAIVDILGISYTVISIETPIQIPELVLCFLKVLGIGIGKNVIGFSIAFQLPFQMHFQIHFL